MLAHPFQHSVAHFPLVSIPPFCTLSIEAGVFWVIAAGTQCALCQRSLLAPMEGLSGCLQTPLFQILLPEHHLVACVRVLGKNPRALLVDSASEMTLCSGVSVGSE